MEEIENEIKTDVKFIVNPKQSIIHYILRNTWIFGLYFIVLILSFIYRLNIKSEFKTLLNWVLSTTLILVIIIYIYNTIKMYLSTRTIRYIFYKNFVKYDDNFLDREQKQITYNHITEVRVKQSIYDRIFKTGTIHLVTPVVNNNGIFLCYIEKPYIIAQNIRDVIEGKE